MELLILPILISLVFVFFSNIKELSEFSGKKELKVRNDKILSVNCKFCSNNMIIKTSFSTNHQCNNCESLLHYNEKKPEYSVWFKSYKIK